MNKKSLLTIGLLYLVSAAVSFGGFSYFGSTGSMAVMNQDQDAEDQTLIGALLEIDPNEPKDQECPLSGAYYTQTEKDAWSVRRPIFIMIENAPDARPQSGLSRADIVYEAIAEGGVTRFGAVMYCNAQLQEISLAPVRSARTYFLDWASGYNFPLYVHVGGANVPGPTNALGQISDYGWSLENDVNQFSVGYPTFVRDYNRVPGKEIATEHTMVTTSELIWDVAEEREWTNLSPERKYGRTTIGGDDWQEEFEGWVFEKEPTAAGSVSTVSYDFWSGYNDYSIKWTFDAQNDVFLREMGGEKHTDLNNDEQISASNVVVLLTVEKGPINEKKHMIYQTTGTGKALVFKHGTAIEATWKKKTRTSGLTFVDSKGKDVELARGLTWISVVDKSTEVEY